MSDREVPRALSLSKERRLPLGTWRQEEAGQAKKMEETRGPLRRVGGLVLRLTRRGATRSALPRRATARRANERALATQGVGLTRGELLAAAAGGWLRAVEGAAGARRC